MQNKKPSPILHLIPDSESPETELNYAHDQDKDITPKPSSKMARALKTAGEEILDGTMEPESWAVALRESNGSKAKAKSLYIEIRSEQIINSQKALKFRQEALEFRVINSFKAVRVISSSSYIEPPESSNTTYWEAILSLGCIAICLTLSTLFTHTSPYVFILFSFLVTSTLVIALKLNFTEKNNSHHGISYPLAICTLSVVVLILTLFSIQITNKLYVWFNL